MNILCIIPARSGSKGIPDKNIKLFHGKPLLAWTIIQAIKCKYKMKIIVSTDSEKYAAICKKYGAEVPFIRPKHLAEDLSTDYEVFEHFIQFLKLNNYIMPDAILHLRPTYPNRDLSLLNNALPDYFNKCTLCLHEDPNLEW